MAGDCPVLSVTPEATANAAFQAAPQWSTRSDQSPANDIFGALVNQNTPSDNAAAPVPPPPARRSDDTPPPADNSAATNNTSNQPASDDSSYNANAGSPANANTNANAGANANAGSAAGSGTTQASATASGTPKTGSAKSTDKAASDDTATVDATILAQASLTTTTPNPVVVAIPVITPPTNVATATPSTGSSTAPLAIAAAAIAASAQPASGQPASPGQVKTDPTAAPAAAATTADATGTKIVGSAVQSATAKAPVIQQAPTQANAAAVNSAALTSAVAATVPVPPKATSAKTVATTAPTDAATPPSGTTDPSATSTAAGIVQNAPQQAAAAGKPEPANAAAEGAPADTTASTTAISAHEHSPVAGATEHAVVDTPDPGTQAIGTFQPQPNSPTAAAPSGALTVTAATNGPVPLSGLAVEIAATVKSGKSSFEIRLDPADLGRIDVRINIDRNGQVTSHLTVEKPETLSMLRQDAPQLQRALDDAGLKTGSGGLQFSLRDQSSSGQNSGNDSSPNAQRLIISNEDTIPAAVAGQSYGRSLGSSSGVDIRV